MKERSPQDILKLLRRLSIRILEAVILVISIIAPLGLVYMFGFPQTQASTWYLETGYQGMLILMWLAVTLRVLLGGYKTKRSKQTSRILWGVYILLTIIAIFNFALRYQWLTDDHFLETVSAPWLVIGTLLIVSGIELGRAVSNLLSRHINPAAILAGSFAIFILVGSLLLMLPNCTYNGISYIDSLFTASSAVCITGLTTVSLPETFTTTGQIIILILVQIGGLGIMTFTSFFAFFFMGQTSLKSQVQLSDILSSDIMGGLGRTLLKIFIVTVSIELFGALLLFATIHNEATFASPGESFYFSIFHSISAFCNAGFSTLPDGLYNPAVRYLWGIPTIISWLVIFGGIGFPIFSNFLTILGNGFRNLFRLAVRQPMIRRPRKWSLNSYIVLKMTAILLIGAWVFVLWAEWNHSLAGYPVSGKLAHGFMMAVTPRSAGFASVNLHQMLPATLILTSILMWIGAGPQSTGGGIKVTTFYIALKNIGRTIRGVERPLEVNKRQIPAGSVRRAFAVIAVTLTTLGVSIIVLSLLEPEIPLDELAFEAVSALGTTGLSLGATPELGDAAKGIIIVLMFVGRVGIVSLMTIFIRRESFHPYSYPKEEILIN